MTAYLILLATVTAIFSVGYYAVIKWSSSDLIFLDSVWSGDAYTHTDSSADSISTTSTVSIAGVDSSNSDTPNVVYYNEYTINKALSGSYPWTDIVEPFRTTTFLVTNPSDSDEFYYEFYVNDYHHTTGIVANISFTDEPGTWQSIVCKKLDASTGEVVSSTEIKAITKYVRREIRSLIDQDREAFFQAVSIMQRVPTQVGKAIYGDKYRSRDFFNRIHLYWGGARSCDHWHQGPGFATSHIAYSRMFEQSLQSIYPAVVLPYWDFTLEVKSRRKKCCVMFE